MNVTAQLDRDITPKDDDYDLVRKTIERISLDYQAQPSLEGHRVRISAVAPGRLAEDFQPLGRADAEGVPAGSDARSRPPAARP